jgi:hypothetical protein
VSGRFISLREYTEIRNRAITNAENVAAYTHPEFDRIAYFLPDEDHDWTVEWTVPAFANPPWWQAAPA